MYLVSQLFLFACNYWLIYACRASCVVDAWMARDDALVATRIHCFGALFCVTQNNPHWLFFNNEKTRIQNPRPIRILARPPLALGSPPGGLSRQADFLVAALD
jgi:hypothetical protein